MDFEKIEIQDISESHTENYLKDYSDGIYLISLFISIVKYKSTTKRNDYAV